jgi:hypothetical protein
MFTKEAIKELLTTSDRAVEKGLTTLLSRQTAEEIATDSTHVHNGRGFSAFDAEFMTSLAKQVEAKIARGVKLGECLSEKQMVYARKKIMRYAGQLAEVANEKLATVEVAKVEQADWLDRSRQAEAKMWEDAIAANNASEVEQMIIDAEMINARDA